MKIPESQKKYYEALHRLILINNKSKKINPDTVALEAGMRRGAIRADRDEFLALIDDIKKAEEKRKKPFLKYEVKIKSQQNKINKLNQTIKEYKTIIDARLNKELILLDRILELENELKSKQSHPLFTNKY
jgi:uncharacterized coiled-coil protein SlyX